jgi:hypothetical protein
LNINGNDGPSLKKFFTCENCKWLSNSVLGMGGGSKPFKCFHDEIIRKYDSSFNLMLGDISEEMITPEICPYLIKKMRNEKLKELYEHRGTEETST